MYERESPKRNVAFLQSVPGLPCQRRTEVFGVHARDDLRHPGRASGQLKQGDVTRTRVRCASPHSRNRCRKSGAQFFKRELAVPCRPPHDNDLFDYRVLANHISRKIRLRKAWTEVALNEIGARARETDQLADFVFPILGQRADRNHAAFEASEQGDDQFLHRAGLENGTISRPESYVQEARRGCLGCLIDIAISQRSFFGDNEYPGTSQPCSVSQLVTDSRPHPGASPSVSHDPLRRVICDALQRKVQASWFNAHSRSLRLASLRSSNPAISRPSVGHCLEWPQQHRLI